MGEGRRLRRGIYLLPTCFTIGNLLCGFASLVQSSRGRFEQAAILIILAGLLDALDGRIARMTGTTSQFGIEFDSLADVVSFGVAPAFLAFRWALSPLGRFGWLAAFIYVVCAATRLARFNLRVVRPDKRYFAGLPSPPAAAALASVAFAFPRPASERWHAAVLGLLVVAVAVLMVSRLRYRSFKDLDLRNRRPYTFVLPLAAVLVAVLTHPKSALLVLSAAYLVSGVLGYLWGLLQRWRGKGPEPAETAQGGPEVADGQV